MPYLCCYMRSNNNIFSLWIRSADVIASIGFATKSNTVPVTISKIYYYDFITKETKDITSLWSQKNCQQAYATVNEFKNTSSCIFSRNIINAGLKTTTAVCQSFVMKVDYSVFHSSNAQGTINSVTAVVVVSDIPVVLNEEISVTQTFSVSFTSLDTTQQSNVNGNIVYRYV